MNILFVAEASAGRSYDFYLANTLLFKTVKQAFEEQYNEPYTDDAFLLFFEKCGCSLEHLCVKTITKESAAKRAAARKKCIPSLAERIKKEDPRMIIVLMHSIAEEVSAAVLLSGVKTVKMIRTTPYPSKSERHRLECIADIRKALTEAKAYGIFS